MRFFTIMRPMSDRPWEEFSTLPEAQARRESVQAEGYESEVIKAKNEKDAQKAVNRANK